ncbi:MAG: ATP phosphoribosyltransferase [Ignisphaera sp.]|nr:ATP phosphoribosyltransferase [Ignisphaera sp.]MCX8167435.1 ATP phosphoribosyltransferase [Ignisphaera sp.]MDW8084701.1 ATP phosphoribosyltransferase [Ignisphaera sp.]
MKIAIPNKGRLQQPAIDLLQMAGIRLATVDEKALILPTNWNGVEIVMIRPEDIPYIIESGGADLGITGHDFVIESGAEVEELLQLGFGKARIVFAVPKAWNVSSVEDVLKIKSEIRIATRYYNIARNYTSMRGIKAKIVRIGGAAEVMPYLGAADAVIDVMSTGTTLRIHGLEPIDTITETCAVLIASKRWRENSNLDKIELMVTMVKGVLSAKGRKMLFMNVPDKVLNNVLSNLPAMLAPAIARLSKSDAWEVITVVDEDELPEIILRAKVNGARDIVVIDIEKVIK